jgi:putative DNA primase/helicase
MVSPIDYRTAQIAAAVTIVRAYLAAQAKEDESTDLELVPFGSFEDWDRFVRSPLVWLGMPDPVGSRSRVAEDDDEGAEQRALVETWAAVFGSKKMKLSMVLRVCGTPDGNEERKEKLSELWEVLEMIAPQHNGGVDARKLGKWFSTRVGRVCNGRVFERDKGGGNTVMWCLPLLSDETEVPE